MVSKKLSKEEALKDVSDGFINTWRSLRYRAGVEVAEQLVRENLVHCYKLAGTPPNGWLVAMATTKIYGITKFWFEDRGW